MNGTRSHTLIPVDSRQLSTNGASEPSYRSGGAAAATTSERKPRRTHDAAGGLYECVRELGFTFDDVCVALEIDGENPDRLVDQMMVRGVQIMDEFRAQQAALAAGGVTMPPPSVRTYTHAPTDHDHELARSLAAEDHDRAERQREEEEAGAAGTDTL
jgi:hypothetical protein